MAMRELDVEIDEKTGDIKFDTQNFKGKGCEELLDKLQAALSATLVSKIEKPEKAMKEAIITKPKQTLKKL